MFNHCTLLQLLFLKNHELEDPNKSGFVSVNMSRYSSFSSDRREGNISATKTIGERRMSSKKKKKTSKKQTNKEEVHSQTNFRFKEDKLVLF